MLILLTLAALNAFSFSVFGLDKLLAKTPAHRIPEKWLLVFTFLGVAGSLLGMSLFRHKTRKKIYRRKAILPVIGGVLLLAAGFWAAILIGL